MILNANTIKNYYITPIRVSYENIVAKYNKLL
jgi:hypothetical protein